MPIYDHWNRGPQSFPFYDIVIQPDKYLFFHLVQDNLKIWTTEGVASTTGSWGILHELDSPFECPFQVSRLGDDYILLPEEGDAYRLSGLGTEEVRFIPIPGLRHRDVRLIVDDRDRGELFWLGEDRVFTLDEGKLVTRELDTRLEWDDTEPLAFLREGLPAIERTGLREARE